MHIVLFEPEIPPNTGNIARLCAGMGAELHLIQPLGFSLEDRYLKRAGLDYWPHVCLGVWPDLCAYMAGAGAGKRLVAGSSRKGFAAHRFAFTRQDALLLGPETRGLPEQALNLACACVRIPVSDKVRSLNLSTAAGILLALAMASTGELDDSSLARGLENGVDAGLSGDPPSRGKAGQ
jgi:tRNA (cytidine/uridine-2'-O-)-methyltransferase